MSHYSKIPQSPRTPGSLQPEELTEESSSSSSSSPTIFTVEQNSIRDRAGPLPSGETLTAQPRPLNSGSDASTRKQHVHSHLHRPDDLHPYSSPEATYTNTLPVDPQSFLGSKQRIYNKACRFWTLNRSYLLVIISTFFGSLMTLLTKLLESEGQGMHAFQILWCRMAVSWVVCAASLYYSKPAEFPFGPKKVRALLIIRGIFGFIGIGGLWTALSKY